MPAVRTVVLDIRFSRFVPSTVRARPGEVVRFFVRNHDPIPHELIVGDQAVQDRHENGTEPHHGERPGEVSVAAGATAQTTYTFVTPGRLFFGCHLPGHWAYGM
ncbi:MAG: plastocyanin/azurin family copper-binding protein, partial [Actinomycetota bacterium]|nr:plastocyanin/azurin family copper-binding protein [Actinomycetota bacterium]